MVEEGSAMGVQPGDAMRRVSITLAGLLVVGILPGPLAGADPMEGRERSVRSGIDRARVDLAHSSARLRSATNRVKVAQIQLADARSRLTDIRRQLMQARDREERAAAGLAEAEARLERAALAVVVGQNAVADQRTDVVDAIVDTIQGNDPRLAMFQALLSAGGPADLVRLDEARDVVVGNESRQYDELWAAEVLLTVEEQGVRSARNAASVLRAAAAASVETVRALRNRALSAKGKVLDRLRTQKLARRQALGARARDRKELRRLRVQERRIAARISAARRAARANDAKSRRSASAFVRPTRGYISSPFGFRTHPIYGYFSLHNGVDIAAPCGTPVYAPLEGRVVSAYYSQVYGNRVFVNLGFVNGRYLTAVFNHMARSAVARGTNVRRGQVVGYVGDTGWSTGCHLHFTLLAGGRPVDPENYF